MAVIHMHWLRTHHYFPVVTIEICCAVRDVGVLTLCNMVAAEDHFQNSVTIARAVPLRPRQRWFHSSEPPSLLPAEATIPSEVGILPEQWQLFTCIGCALITSSLLSPSEALAVQSVLEVTNQEGPHRLFTMKQSVFLGTKPIDCLTCGLVFYGMDWHSIHGDRGQSDSESTG
ncbi:uncharacterized protein [Dermacentor albipictus]|uniref:uncharacterized protein isoform X6 n=1 Tax=Dermacentor albipictus TaxID=60249 RepID=UPI0031FE2911